MALLEPLSYSLTVGTDQLADIVKSITGCIKKDIRNGKKQLASVTTDATSALVQGAMVTGAQLADVLQYIPSGIILGSPTGSLRGTPGAGLGQDIILGGGMHPYPMPQHVDPSRPDLHPPPIHQTTTPEPRFQQPLPTVPVAPAAPTPEESSAQQSQQSTPDTPYFTREAADNGQAVQPRTPQPAPKTSPEAVPKISPPTQQPPAEATPEAPAKKPEVEQATESTGREKIETAGLFDLSDLAEFDVGVTYSAAQQSEAGQQPSETFGPILFGD